MRRERRVRLRIGDDGWGDRSLGIVAGGLGLGLGAWETLDRGATGSCLDPGEVNSGDRLRRPWLWLTLGDRWGVDRSRGAGSDGERRSN